MALSDIPILALRYLIQFLEYFRRLGTDVINEGEEDEW